MSNPALKEPFYGFMPRKVVAKEAQRVLVRIFLILSLLITP